MSGVMSFELSGHMTYFQPPHSYKREEEGIYLTKNGKKDGEWKNCRKLGEILRRGRIL